MKASLPLPKQHRLAWKLAGLLNTKIDRIFDLSEVWVAGAFIPDPTAIEALMVQRGQYDGKTDPCESLYDAIERAYGAEARRIVGLLVGEPS